MSGTVKILAVGGLGWWAYQNGHLDPVVAYLRSLGVGAGGDAQAAPVADPVTPLTALGLGGGFDLPQIAPDNPPISYAGPMTDEEILLRQNWDDVQPWAKSNVKWAAAMMWQESRGNTSAIGPAGARGVLQVMPGTMRYIYDRLGYRKYAPEPMTLHLPNVGIYFGTAYMQHLHDDYASGGNIEWTTRAYNAGPGGQRSDGTWPSETVNYLAQIKARYAEIS